VPKIMLLRYKKGFESILMIVGASFFDLKSGDDLPHRKGDFDQLMASGCRSSDESFGWP
jgi:hypothetical protein